LNAPAKTAYRYNAPDATAIGDSGGQTTATWTRTDADNNDVPAADDDITGNILVWDAVNNTLLVELQFFQAVASESAYTSYTYDDNDQFNTGTDAGGTAAAVTMAAFETALGTCLAVGAIPGVAFSPGDLDGVTNAALAGNAAKFNLGTCS